MCITIYQQVPQHTVELDILKLFCSVIILYYLLRLISFPLLLSFLNYLSFSYPTPTFPFLSFFFLSNGVPFSLSNSPASESLSYHHDCGLTLRETFAFSLSYFCLLSFILLPSLFHTFAFSLSYFCLPLVYSTHFLVTINHSLLNVMTLYPLR